MASSSRPDRVRWYFSKEQILNTPTIKCGIDPEKELSYRQQAANLIQDMGQRLQVFQLCINTAIVYMHRFYMFHSFTKFPRNSIAAASLFLAAKVEEQPHKLEHVIRVAHACLHRGEPPLDPRSNSYAQQAQELVINESIILQTLGFEVGVVHPHTHVVKCTQMIRASKDLSQSSYFLATNSLHLTTFSVKYKPTVVACVCIHLACKWTSWTIPKSNDGKGWWEYVDNTVTEEHLDELTREFLSIIDRCPTRLRKRIMGYRGKDGKHLKTEGHSTTDSGHAAGSSQGQGSVASAAAMAPYDMSHDTNAPATGFDNYSEGEDEPAVEKDNKTTSKEKPSASTPAAPAPPVETPRKTVSLEEYKRKAERERKEKEMKMKREESTRVPSDKVDLASLAGVRPSSKDSRQSGQKLGPLGVDNKSQGSSESRLHEKLQHSGKDKRSSSHERLHTGHDRIPGHEKIPYRDKHGQDKNAARPGRTSQGQDKIPSGHTRGPSGPERSHSSQERSSSGSLKVVSSGREHSGFQRPPGEKVSASHGMKPQDRSLVPPHPSILDASKYSSIKHREHVKPENNTTPLSSKDATFIKNERPSGSGIVKKEGESGSRVPSVKGSERSDKTQREGERQEYLHQSSKVSKKPSGHRTSDAPVPHIPPVKKEQTASEPEQVTQEHLTMLTMFRDEIIKDLESDKHLDQDVKKDVAKEKNDAGLSTKAPTPVSVKTERTEPKMSHHVEVASPAISDTKPIVPFELPDDEKELEAKRAQLLNLLSSVASDEGENSPAESNRDKETVERKREKESSERKREKESTERKREKESAERKREKESEERRREKEFAERERKREKEKERERRKELHRQKKEEKRQRSHKHRHESPTAFQKIPHENDLAEGSGDMVPAKKQKTEHIGSPHTVLTTSKGIKLKIKGLSNSFNNGSDHSHAKTPPPPPPPPNPSSDSPSLSLKLNLSKIHDASSRESSREREGSSNHHHHHHRSHHKHKSRHHRSKDGHHRKRPRSPGMSSASDASPATLTSPPSMKRTPDSALPPNQSLLNLPMPPMIKQSFPHSSPPPKHPSSQKRKHEYRPPLPNQDASPSPPPPPPPPKPALSTIDMSALGLGLGMDYHPPLPRGGHINDRPPPPPPIPSPQKRPPLPP